MPLADQQAALMAALLGSRPVPSGFEARRIQAAAASLAAQRARSVRRVWPGVADMLGERFDRRFADYAHRHLLPVEGGALADGRNFVQWLCPTDPPTDAVRWQLLRMDLRFQRTALGWRPRRGPGIRAAWLAGARRWVMLVCLPGVVSCHVSIGRGGARIHHRWRP